MRGSEPGFGIYIHWPFCRAKCPYCDFNSHVRDAIDQSAWRDALLRDLAAQRARFGAQRVTSIFFGGGTPSLMEPATVAALIDAVTRDFPYTDNLEITLEANPTSVEAERFKGFRAAGVNRVSIGVQALDDAALKFLGRQHSAAEALGAITIARTAFPRVSFDLIYARPDQTERAWRAELARALALGPEHLSLYQLTFEPGTPMGERHVRGQLAGLDDERAAALYELTKTLCEEAGLPAYEISNHARLSAECRHNLVYWRYGDYLGIGPGAHGRIGGMATQAIRAPEAWRQAIAQGGEAFESVEPLAPATQAQEYLLMSLRLTEGLSRTRYHALGGAPFDAERLSSLAENGFVTYTDEHVAATAQGRLVLNRIIAELVASDT